MISQAHIHPTGHLPEQGVNEHHDLTVHGGAALSKRTFPGWRCERGHASSQAFSRQLLASVWNCSPRTRFFTCSVTSGHTVCERIC